MKIFRNIIAGACLVTLGVVFYYAYIVLEARAATPVIVREALAADKMKLKVSDLSKWQLDALLAVEDPAFYSHNGIDLQTKGAGLTTITQALVKIFYFENFRPGIAKFRQSLIAKYALDPLVPKDDQLALFINYIYLGRAAGGPVYGFNNAAEAYFNKPFNKLKQDEYLSLVAMIIAPKNFGILSNPGANAERTRRIKMLLAGRYRPVSLMDLYYGQLDEETQKGLAPASYFPSIYGGEESK